MIFAIICPIFVLVAFFVGVGMGAGKTTFHPFLQLLAARQKHKEVAVKAEPNRCQCGHMKVFHNDGGRGGCQADNLRAKVGNGYLQCGCTGYLSSQVGEIVNLEHFPVASNEMYDPTQKRALESGKSSKPMEGEIL